MNYLLSLNKRYVYLFFLLVSFFILIFFIYKFIENYDENINENSLKFSGIDIAEPRFTISGRDENINITAKEGNFIGEDKVLLNKEVIFDSSNFSIQAQSVIINRKEQSAISNYKSLFKSKKTIIVSDGFNIHQGGLKIEFYGKSKITIK